MLTTAAARYRRPVVAVRTFRYVMGNGLLLAEGDAWRGQRRMLAPVFSPAHVGELLPHFHAAGGSMIRRLEDRTQADLSSEFNQASLDALLRALFSTPADTQGSEMAGLVRRYIGGPGRPRFSDGLARREEDFAWLGRGAPSLSRSMVRGGRCARRRPAAIPTYRRHARPARRPVRRARSRHRREQAEIRREIESFPPERVTGLEDLDNWPRLRCALLETLRLYPPLALVVRQAVAPDEVLGEAIEPGDLIWISPWTLHRHRAYWTHPTAFMQVASQASRNPGPMARSCRSAAARVPASARASPWPRRRYCWRRC